MTLIHAKDVRKKFGNTEVLKGISLDVLKGETISIIGPSGSGKSTFLRILTQLETADSGYIEICDNILIDSNKNPIFRASEQTALKMQLNTGLVFQNFCLFPHMSILENIIHPQINVLKTNKNEALEIARKLLAKMNLAQKEDAYPCELSGGQQQRIAIARALALNPRVLFFDEPTSALDPELTGEILKVLKELSNEDITMIIVTHEMEFAKNISDRVLFLDEGEAIEVGTPKEVFDNPSSDRVKAFLQKYGNENWKD